jgi:maltooligosyltrehalose trehalohydrolase
MIFMGEEYGEQNPFLFFCSFGNGRLVESVRAGRRRDYGLLGQVPDPQAEFTFTASRLTWSWAGSEPRSGLRRLYADLLAARREWPALRDFRGRAARLLPDEKAGPILELVRGGTSAAPGQTLQAYFNLRAESVQQPVQLRDGERVLFSSEGSRYSGNRRPEMPVGELLPHECLVVGPAGWRKVG